MLEIELYYGVEDVNDLSVWARQFNISAREMAPVILGQKGSSPHCGFLASVLKQGSPNNQ